MHTRPSLQSRAVTGAGKRDPGHAQVEPSTVPAPFVFMVRFLRAAFYDKEMEHLVFFLAELGLMRYGMITYCLSIVAAAMLYAALCMLKERYLWTETLTCHTGFTDMQLLQVSKIVRRFVMYLL